MTGEGAVLTELSASKISIPPSIYSVETQKAVRGAPLKAAISKSQI